SDDQKQRYLGPLLHGDEGWCQLFSEPAAGSDLAGIVTRAVPQDDGGYDMSKEAARRAYEKAQTGPADVQVIELHDCFSANELITYEALGLAEEGHGHELIDAADTTYGGRWVVNPSGGLISKGHPLGATG